MKSIIVCFLSSLLLLSQSYASDREHPNLFPNGDVDNIFLNQIVQEKGYRSHIEASGTGLPTYWRLTEGAMLSRDIKFGGEYATKLSRRKKDVTATVFSDYWKVKDASMPFGLPLVPQKEITVAFRYKTSGLKGAKVMKASIKLGTIKDLPSRKVTLELPASNAWKVVTKKIILDQLKWGAEVVFTLPGVADKTGSVWIDDVFLSQNLDGINLVKNYSFEDETVAGTLPPDWQIPIEDQWVSWVGARYRKPTLEVGEAVSGNQSLRASVTYADGSGVAQLIPLHQKTVKPVVIDIWSKLDNSIGNRPPGYWGPDNLANVTVFIYHYDGTMQEVNPTFCLGESDHDWNYRRFGFLPQKPIKEFLLQITQLGSEPTTSLWVDKVRAFELGATSKELQSRGVDFPARSISSKWGAPAQLPVTSDVEVFNDAENIYLSLPNKFDDEQVFVYLNPQTKSAFVNHYRYLFDVIKIAPGGKAYKGITVEKQGYTADGLFEPADKYGIAIQKNNDLYLLTIPFRALGMDGVTFQPFGFNIMWQNGNQKVYWTGNANNNKEMGQIILAKEPGVRIKNIVFGKRYFYEKDQSQDYISHPQLYAGMNEAVITLVNEGSDCQVNIPAGIKGNPLATKKVNLKRGETKSVVLSYQAGLKKLTDFNIAVVVNNQPIIQRSYPIQVPPTIEIVLDQEFYYPEEDSARIEIHNRYRPIPQKGKVQIKVTDLRNNKVVHKFTKNLSDSVTIIPLDIHNFRINPLPVQDYTVAVTYLDGDQNILGEQIKPFGRIHHAQRRKLPPIEKLTVDDKGRIIINDNFRFFPIVPSVNIMDWHEAIDMGANIYRIYTPTSIDSTAFKERDRAWAKNVYSLTIGPFDSKIMDEFAKKAESFLVHPGFLAVYAKQFYYWKLPPEYIEMRKRVERIVGNVSSPRLVIWGHHDSSFLYDRSLSPWPDTNDPPVGYCYVKIMGRPGSAWRNSPFLTKTEMVLNPHRFKLAEVNYYVAFHGDEVVPEHFPGNLSLRGDDWRGLRYESYLAIIYGAHGLYHWICTQKKDLQRLRGWFQELNYMWPIYVADDAENKIVVSPANAGIEVRLKKWQGKYYLLAASRFETEQKGTIRIQGFKKMKVRKLFELPGDLVVEGNNLSDVWKKYDAHVYEIVPTE